MIAPNNTTKVIPNRPKPGINEPFEVDCTEDGSGSLADGITEALLDRGVLVATGSDGTALEDLLDVEVPEEEVELEEPLFVF